MFTKFKKYLFFYFIFLFCCHKGNYLLASDVEVQGNQEQFIHHTFVIKENNLDHQSKDLATIKIRELNGHIMYTTTFLENIDELTKICNYENKIENDLAKYKESFFTHFKGSETIYQHTDFFNEEMKKLLKFQNNQLEALKEYSQFMQKAENQEIHTYQNATELRLIRDILYYFYVQERCVRAFTKASQKKSEHVLVYKLLEENLFPQPKSK